MHEHAGRGPALSRARLLVVVWLVSAVASIVLLPLVGVVREPTTGLRLAGLVGLGGLFVAQLLVLWSAVTPWASPRTHRLTQGVFVTAAVASLPLVAPASPVEWATWAWLGAGVVGTAPLLWRWPTALLVAVVTTLASLTVALSLDARPLTYLAITLGIGSGVAMVNWVPVWLWDLLVRADATRLAEARAAAAQERLRFGRDVHDVLGHDLTVIALKAELAGRTAALDPVASARESEEVRALAEAALARTRASLARDREVDLPAEIDRMGRVLTAAGLRCDVDADLVEVPPPVAGVLAMVLKEASTNVLRHSDATSCEVQLRDEGDRVVLAVTNDRPRPGPDDAVTVPGSGLHGLRGRLAAVGGDLATHRDERCFRLRATVPAEHG